MSPESILAPLRWQQHKPVESDAVVHVPLEMVDAILEGYSGNGRVCENSVQVERLVNQWKPRLAASPGFVCLRVPDASFTDDDLRAVYAVMSKSLGQLNQRYGEFFDVKDHGLDHTKSAIPISKTRACSGFHTDSSSVDYCPEVVGLLCLQPGFRGGESLLANAADLYCWLWKNHRISLPSLEMPIKRDVITPGTVQNSIEIDRNAFPIINLKDGKFQFRYMRYWISQAYQKLEMELPQGLEKAMDLVDQFFHDSQNVFSTKLSRGEMLFVNNHHLCHSRTAFLDAPDGVHKRTLVRTWIDSLRTGNICDAGIASSAFLSSDDWCAEQSESAATSEGIHI